MGRKKEGEGVGRPLREPPSRCCRHHSLLPSLFGGKKKGEDSRPKLFFCRSLDSVLPPTASLPHPPASSTESRELVKVSRQMRSKAAKMRQQQQRLNKKRSPFSLPFSGWPTGQARKAS
ncbi:hypothetical protein cyc_03457 [Cyclospora cayetanensis]|uniref:Uncharacterized protein n=1 Tax=Cyclospora cayetanensis TaxID=88456 RepID=A0A1D3D2V7_9EIME|nr:hypothetical protein cyc_03457 [Cyclospora cayetanensis]